MASLRFFGLQMGVKACLGQVRRPNKTHNHARCPKARGPTSPRPYTRGIIVMDSMNNGPKGGKSAPYKLQWRKREERSEKRASTIVSKSIYPIFHQVFYLSLIIVKMGTCHFPNG